MTPNELRKLADTLGGFPTDEPRRRAAAYLREQADAMERGAVAHVVSSGEFDFPLLRWLSADISLSCAIGDKLYPHPAPQSVPVGWQMVPVEATPEMREAASPHKMLAITPESYRAMLAASPPASCIGSDSACPCHDGDACHYRDAAEGTKGWQIPAPAGTGEALRELIDASDECAESDTVASGLRYHDAIKNARAALAAADQAIERCQCGYPMPCAEKVPITFCRAADQQAAMQRVTDIGQDLGLYESKAPKCD